MRQVVTNVRPWGGEPADIVIEGDRIEDVRSAGEAEADARRLDGRGLLALPGLVNAHAHVDKSWWGLPWVSAGERPATTAGAIAYERAERDGVGIPRVESTVAVLREFLRHGTTAVRTHVDVDLGVGMRGIETVRAAAAELEGAIEVSVVAFPQDGVVRRPGVLDLLDTAAAAGAEAVGGLDPASIDRDPVAQLDGLFAIAERRDVGLDIHLHDPGDLGAFQIELIAERTRRAGLGGRVTVSHGFALGQLAPERQQDLVAELADAGVSWTTVAPAGSARLPWREMRSRGVPLGLGTDGIRDLWSPFGDGDMLRIALGFARLHGLRTDEELTYAVELIARRAGGFVGRPSLGLEAGARADVVLLDAENVAHALVAAPPRETVIAGGRVVVERGEWVL